MKQKLSKGDSSLWEREWVTVENLLRLSEIELPSKGVVLDAGCGLKGLKDGAEARGLSYVGLDIEDLDFEIEKVSSIVSGATIAFSLAVIEHLASPITYLRGLREALEPGAPLVLSTPNITFARESFWDNPGHLHPYTAKSLHEVLDASGFRVHGLFPGLRGKPDWMVSGKNAMSLAANLPIRKNYVSGPLKYLSGRSTSIIAVASTRLVSGPRKSKSAGQID